MHEKNYYRFVNWADGMKLNKNHFIDEQHALVQQLSWAAGTHINAVNYGLLPAFEDGKMFQLHIYADTQQQVNVRLQYCNAVTPGGYRVYIDETAMLADAMAADVPGMAVPFSELKGKTGVYFVVLSMNPYQQLPVGSASIDEVPPRLPYTMPAYYLSLMPAEDLQGKMPGFSQLCIGKVFVKEQAIQVDADYIPPCVNIHSHPKLIFAFEELEVLLIETELYVTQILQKIIQKDQQNLLADIVKHFCLVLQQYCGAQVMQFRWMQAHMPPVAVLSTTASVSRLLKNTIDQYIGAGKEELMNYLAEWCELNQGELDELMLEISTSVYSHEDIAAAISKNKHFMTALRDLLLQLSRLDYIGKKKEVNIFIKEEKVTQGVKTAEQEQKRMSFLGD
jgi:hypothetical protein